MRLIGRWERVRPVGASGVGPAYFLDRRWGTLTPVGGDDGWWKSPAGIWRRVGPTLYDQHGGFSSRQFPRVIFPWIVAEAISANTLALNNAYTYNTAGNAAADFQQRTAAVTLSAVYVFISSYTGTAGNVTSLNLEVRNNGASKPGTTLHASATLNPASATGWVSFTGLSFTVVAGTLYWIIVADADGNGTDFATVLTSASAVRNVSLPELADRVQITTTGGWASAITNNVRGGALVTVWSDGSFGNPFSSNNVSASSSNQKGLRLGGLSANIKLWAVMQTTATAVTGLNIWSATGGPSGTADIAASTSALNSGSTAGTGISGFYFATPVLLRQTDVYRIVFTQSGTTLGQLLIGTGADANLKAAMPGAGASYYAEANGTTNWNNDDTSRFPQMTLILEDLFGYPYVNAGMTGGMRG